MLKFVEEFQRDDSEDDQASREEPNVSEGCRKAFLCLAPYIVQSPDRRGL